MKGLYPPAIVKPVESVEALVAEAKAVYGAIYQAERANLARAIDLGKMLLQIKEICAHGQFEQSLKSIDIPRQRASEWMRLAKCPAPGISNCESIREAMALMEALEKDDSKPAKMCRPCRTKGYKPGCMDCAELNPPDDGEEDEDLGECEVEEDAPELSQPLTDSNGAVVPDQLIPVFSELNEWDTAKKNASAATKAIRAVEAGAAYQAILKKHRPLNLEKQKVVVDSTFFRRAAMRLQRERPEIVCPDCKGIEASEDAEVCDRCKGAGFLCKGELS